MRNQVNDFVNIYISGFLLYGLMDLKFRSYKQRNSVLNRLVWVFAFMNKNMYKGLFPTNYVNKWRLLLNATECYVCSVQVWFEVVESSSRVAYNNNSCLPITRGKNFNVHHLHSIQGLSEYILSC